MRACYADGQVLQNGQTTVRADNLVVIPQIEVFRENIRKVRISVFDPSVPTSEAESVEALRISPNLYFLDILTGNNLRKVGRFVKS